MQRLITSALNMLSLAACVLLLCGHNKGLRYIPSYCSLVKELSSLRKKACDKNALEAAVHLLANMIHAIKDCTSVLRERKHDTLLNEVLGINMWTCAQVTKILIS